MIPRRFLVRLSLHLTPWTRRSYTAFAVHRQHRIQVPARRNAGGQCTSSLTSRGFTATSRLFRVLSEQPLDVEAFERALRSCWTPLEDSALPENALPCPPHRIGLAISGGVDSMALAGLCEHLQKTKPDVYHFHGIVVNHRARPGASQEAAEVQEMLQNMGLDASMRAIEWPAGTEDPLDLPDFETRARRERYRLLGLECASKRLRYLLLAHHGNDQVEGILGRIIAGYTGSGLKGMKRMGPIPECRGLWGVSEGPRTIAYSQSVGPLTSSSTRRCARATTSALGLNMRIAAAGITIHRPFLLFTKSALRSTCEHFGIRWKEDNTNRVLGLTLRNTTRSLLEGQKLPAALCERSLAGLAARKSRFCASVHNASEDAPGRLRAVRFDPRIGQLTLEISREDVGNICRRPTRLSKGHYRSCVPETYSIVHRLVTAVSPRSHIEQDAVKDFASAFVRALEREGVDRFTGGGVWWRKDTNHESAQQTDVQVWSLCRQPMSRNERHESCMWANITNEYKLALTEQPQRGCIQPFESWQLVDNRFWLSVEASSKEPVLAKLLDKPSLTQLRDTLDQQKRKVLDQQLRAIAPGESRFTLPALADSKGRLLALPTIGFVHPAFQARLKWQWCYKHIDLG